MQFSQDKTQLPHDKTQFPQNKTQLSNQNIAWNNEKNILLDNSNSVQEGMRLKAGKIFKESTFEKLLDVSIGQILAMTASENCVWKIRLFLSMPGQRDWSIGKSFVSI